MGKRGPQKGTLYAPTRQKAEMREAVKRAYDAALPAMLHAQIANATGISYLVARNGKTGKFERVTAEMLESDQELERVEVWQKDPSVQAWTDLSNRVLDKPAESMDMHITGDVDIVTKLQAARARLKKRG